MKKIFNISGILLLFLAGCCPLNTKAQITPQEAAQLMQKGINLGNTLEPPFEGDWNPPAQQYYFDLYKQAGFNTVRIPVRWDEHTQDTGSFKIDPAWMQRVEQIVDWGLSRDLFIVINAHHEEWIKSGYGNANNRARFDSIWSQISVRFKNKPDKLLFEIINEPYGLTKEQNNELHARELSIIRKTNPTRIVIIQGHGWGGSDELIATAIPEDNYIMGSFHSYDPYLFGLQGQGTWGTTTDYNTLRTKFQLVKNWSDANNIPVFLGEFGSLRTCDYNSRMKHYRAYVEYAQQFGFISCAWDDGGDFRIMERAARTWDEVKDILINTNIKAPRNLAVKVVEDTVIQVTWTNGVADADSIFIEHRLPTGKYVRIASLQGDASIFRHLHATENLYHHYRIIAHYNSGNDFYSQPMRVYLPAYVPKFRSLYLGQPLAIPGIIEAEYFDIGGEGLTYHDFTFNNIYGELRPDEGVDIYTGNGQDFIVGYLMAYEWMEYTVNIQNSGPYKVDFHIAAYQAGGLFALKIGEKETGSLRAAASSSLTSTIIVSDTMDLDAGEQIMRLTIISDHPSFNLDKISFTEVSLPVTTIETEILPLAVRFDRSGNLSVYWDQETTIDLIQLYNINGEVILSVNHPENNLSITTDKFPAGLYLLKACSGKQSSSFKLIIH